MTRSINANNITWNLRVAPINGKKIGVFPKMLEVKGVVRVFPYVLGVDHRIFSDCLPEARGIHCETRLEAGADGWECRQQRREHVVAAP